MTTISELSDRLQAATKGDISMFKGAPFDRDALIDAPTPEFGTISWEPPPSYAECLSKLGHFALRWPNDEGVIELLDADGIEENSEFVYLPEGVSFGDDLDLSTNHLVPFAYFDGESVFCFDISSKNAEYPVYYHHQDNEYSFRFLDTDETVLPNATPHFESFAACFEWIVKAVENKTSWDDLGLYYPEFEV